jgi:hypothetical protein
MQFALPVLHRIACASFNFTITLTSHSDTKLCPELIDPATAVRRHSTHGFPVAYTFTSANHFIFYLALQLYRTRDEL